MIDVVNIVYKLVWFFLFSRDKALFYIKYIINLLIFILFLILYNKSINILINTAEPWEYKR